MDRRLWLDAVRSASGHLHLRGYSAQIYVKEELFLDADDLLPYDIASVRVGTVAGPTVCWLTVLTTGAALLPEQILRFERELFGDSAVESTVVERAAALRKAIPRVFSVAVSIKLAQLWSEDLLLLDFCG